jgi:hypothetical protein
MKIVYNKGTKTFSESSKYFSDNVFGLFDPDDENDYVKPLYTHRSENGLKEWKESHEEKDGKKYELMVQSDGDRWYPYMKRFSSVSDKAVVFDRKEKKPIDILDSKDASKKAQELNKGDRSKNRRYVSVVLTNDQAKELGIDSK